MHPNKINPVSPNKNVWQAYFQNLFLYSPRYLPISLNSYVSSLIYKLKTTS